MGEPVAVTKLHPSRVAVVDGKDPRVARLVRAARQSFDASDEAILAMDGQGRRVYSNPAFDQLVGWDGAALEGRRPPFPYWDPESTPRMREQVQAMLDGRLGELGVRAVEGRFVGPDGRAFDVVMVGHQIRDGSGEPLLHLVTVRPARVDDRAEIARWLSQTLALQRFRDAVLRLDGVMEGLADRPRADLPAPTARLETLPGWTSLTSREREVLVRVVEGLRVTHVAEDLGIQPATVRNHLKAIFRKTGLRSQAQLVEAARRVASAPDAAPDSGEESSA